MNTLLQIIIFIVGGTVGYYCFEWIKNAGYKKGHKDGCKVTEWRNYQKGYDDALDHVQYEDDDNRPNLCSPPLRLF